MELTGLLASRVILAVAVGVRQHFMRVSRLLVVISRCLRLFLSEKQYVEPIKQDRFLDRFASGSRREISRHYLSMNAPSFQHSLEGELKHICGGPCDPDINLFTNTCKRRCAPSWSQRLTLIGFKRGKSVVLAFRCSSCAGQSEDISEMNWTATALFVVV